MSAEESRQFHQHPLRAQLVLTPVAQLNQVAHIIRHQYERFNGRGAPDGVAGDDIPLGARILAVARDYEGLQRGGVVNQRMQSEQAIALIKSQAGMRYDPQVVDRFAALAKDPATLGCNTPYAQITGGQLLEGMRLADDLRTSRGVQLTTNGSVVSASGRARAVL